MLLQSQNLYLRALEPEDLDFIYTIENNESVWEVSHTITPYSRFLIKQYLENAHQDIYEAKQLRLVICSKVTQTAIGLIDLFDFEPMHRRAGIGILIQNTDDRHKGYGSEALQMLINYAFQILQLHQLYANISSNNAVSIKLFTTFGFEKIGNKKDWNFVNGTYQDELLYQLINVKEK